MVVANPPYMGSSNMNSWLSGWTKKRYKEVHKDLCTCFIKRGFSLSDDRGYEALITSDTCMYISSFEKMREEIIEQTSIVCFIDTRGTNAHPDVFDANAGWVLWNHPGANIKGSYFKLNHPIPEKSQRLLEALANPDCGWFYRCASYDFGKVPGSPIAYWISNSMLNAFDEFAPMSETASPKQGLATGDNDLFIRQWWEIGTERTGFGFADRAAAHASGCKWFPCNKGGGYRKWFGNNELVVNWENDGEAIKGLVRNGKQASRPQNTEWYFKEGMTWGTISSADLSMRYSPAGYMFETKGSMCFAENKDSLLYCLAFTNSSVVKAFQKILSPTLDFHEGPIGKLPLACEHKSEAVDLAQESVLLAKDDWDSFEISFEFKKHPLI